MQNIFINVLCKCLTCAGTFSQRSVCTQWFIQTPQGVITPSFHATPPTIWSSKGVIRGVYGGVYVIILEGVKYWREPIYLLYETNNAQKLVILFSGILLKLLPPCTICAWKHFAAKMHQIRFRLGLRPRLRWGAYSAPPDPLAGFKGPYF